MMKWKLSHDLLKIKPNKGTNRIHWSDSLTIWWWLFDISAQVRLIRIIHYLSTTSEKVSLFLERTIPIIMRNITEASGSCLGQKKKKKKKLVSRWRNNFTFTFWGERQEYPVILKFTCLSALFPSQEMSHNRRWMYRKHDH